MSAALSGSSNELRMRLRRTNSTSKAEDIVTEDAKVRKSQPDKPIHRWEEWESIPARARIKQLLVPVPETP